MCIIIDINTLVPVFVKDSKYHSEFKPVFDWIDTGKGKVVWGGTEYINELKKTYKFLKYFNLLTTAKKAIFIDSKQVDPFTEFAKSKFEHRDYDDPHIVGLLLATKIKLVCSADKRAHPYMRHSDFFKPASQKPHIYSSKRNENLLCDNNIADFCKPCTATTNAQKTLISSIKVL